MVVHWIRSARSGPKWTTFLPYTDRRYSPVVKHSHSLPLPSVPSWILQLIDGVVFEGESKFLLHYNFPPYSTGEARPLRGTGRREIGHGNLALRALKNMLPEENPYTIRVVSEILESNGSSSMATVCAGSMALMDAGVQMKKPVAGIAMGLISDPGMTRYAVLSDILGDEDHLGDMDFKVTGTADGITATQMDIKVDGLNYEVLEKLWTRRETEGCTSWARWPRPSLHRGKITSLWYRGLRR